MKTVRMGVLLVLAFVCLSGCALVGHGSGSGDGMMTWDQANVEYRNSTQGFPVALPAGDVFPASMPPAKGSSGQLFGEGYGAMQAYFFAQCAYEKVAIEDQSTDQAAVSSALDAIERIDALPVWQQHYEDGDGGWKGAIDKARLGDFTVFTQFFDSDCTSPWTTAGLS